MCIDVQPQLEQLEIWDRPFYEQIHKEMAFLIKENEQATHHKLSEKFLEYKNYAREN